MRDEYTDHKIETKAADSSSGSYAPPAETIPAQEAPDQELYHAKSFWTKWVFCQDAKVIGIQYGITALLFMFLGFSLMMVMRWHSIVDQQIKVTPISSRIQVIQIQ